MAYERLLNKSVCPSSEDIKVTIGERYLLWEKIHQFIEQHYDFEKQLAFFSKNYGWTVRYRKGSKTLISCFPEHGAFSVLLVLGMKESEKVNQVRNELNENFLSVFDATEQLRDGKWMWIRMLNDSDLESIIKVLQIKRKPKKQTI